MTAPQGIVQAALDCGQVKKGGHCDACGRPATKERVLHGHHSDYHKPLLVFWLCTRCHSRWHANHEARKVAKRREVVYFVASKSDVGKWRKLAELDGRKFQNWLLWQVTKSVRRGQ